MQCLPSLDHTVIGHYFTGPMYFPDTPKAPIEHVAWLDQMNERLVTITARRENQITSH
jgi:hypothetical protein